MRLHELVLINYIGIYNGMGMTNISIPFYKCKNAITLIKGDNGSGKSTIYKALTPFADPSNSFIPGKPANKMISYIMNDGDLITIRYSHEVSNNGERKQAKCDITRTKSTGESISLNPSRNIMTGKDIINDIFDFDSAFVSLSHLSSEDRGIADKKPAERKKLLNSIIDSISVYNDIYKNLSKQSSALKSMITSINNKITSIGDVSYIEARVKQLEEERLRLENSVSEKLLESGKLMALIGDQDKDSLYNKYQELYKRHEMLTSYISEYRFEEKADLNFKIDLNKQKEILSNEKEVLASLKAKKDVIYPITSNLKDKLDSVIERKNFLIDNENEYKTTQSMIDITEKNLKELYKDFAKYKPTLEVVNDSTLRLFSSAVNNINSILTEIHKIVDTYGFESLDHAINYVFDGIPNPIEFKEVEEYKKSLSSMEIEHENQCMFKRELKTFPKIPKECKISDKCPFASETAKMLKLYKGDNNLNNLAKDITALRENIIQRNINNEEYRNIEKLIEHVKNIASIYDSYKDIFTSMGLKTDTTDIKRYIIRCEHLTVSTELYNQGINLKKVIDDSESTLKNLKEKISTMTNAKEELDKLEEEIERLQKEYKENSDELKRIDDDIFRHGRLVQIAQVNAQKLEISISDYENYNNYISKLESVKKDLEEAKKKYEDFIKYKHEFKVYEDEIEHINLNQLPGIINEVNKLKYNLVLYNDYLKEYKEFSDRFNTVEVVKKHTSPTTGIQTVFMNMYMNDIVTISNQLLGMMFGGEYVLHPFIINENEFRIPCSGSGILNDDVSSMSNAQICMISLIISFALLHKSSSVYNIIRLDEIDAALDHHNRIMFHDLLMRIMSIINASQCVMISHNSEFDMNYCDVILLRFSDPNLKIEGNVIFKV